MTFGVETSASSDTSILAGQSSLLSFLRGSRKGNNTRTATGNPSTQAECSVEHVYDSELQPEVRQYIMHPTGSTSAGKNNSRNANVALHLCV